MHAFSRINVTLNPPVAMKTNNKHQRTLRTTNANKITGHTVCVEQRFVYIVENTTYAKFEVPTLFHDRLFFVRLGTGYTQSEEALRPTTYNATSHLVNEKRRKEEQKRLHLMKSSPVRLLPHNEERENEGQDQSKSKSSPVQSLPRNVESENEGQDQSKY